MRNKPGKLFFLFILLIFFTAIRGAAQSYPMRHYTVADGLPSNNVYCVYKDSKGILWFATEKGIARYNGDRFERFSTADGLPDNEIFCFGEDKYHRLWMGTYNGSLCYYKDGIIHTAANTPFLRLPVKNSFIYNIGNEYDGSVTIKFHSSDYFLNIVGDKINVLNVNGLHEDSRVFIQVVKIAPTKYQLIYEYKRINWDTSGKVLYQTPARRVRGALISNDRHYLVFNDFIVSGGRTVCSAIPDPDSLKIQCILEDPQRNLTMMATSTGVFVLPAKTQLFKDHEVSSIAKDVSDNYWIATTDAGVFCINTAYQHFNVFNNPDKTAVRYARILNGQLYFATKSGNIYTLRNDRIQTLFGLSQYRQDFERKHPVAKYWEYQTDQPGLTTVSMATQHGLQSQKFSIATHLDDSGHFYYASSWETSIFDQLQQDKAHLARSIPLLYYYSVKDIALSKEAIYINASIAAFYIPRSVMENHDYTLIEKLKTNPAKNERLYGWATDQDGKVWTSTVDSLYKIEGNKITVQPQFGAIRLRKFGFWNGFLMGYTPDNTLLICHLRNGKMITDTTINGSSIWSDFYPLDSSHVLISTNDKYRIATLTHPGEKNGFRIQTVESRFVPIQAEYVCADTSVSYFFNNGTITRFDTKRLFNTSAKPIVYLISLRTKDSVYAATQSAAFTIPHRQAGDLQVAYLPLSFDGGDIRCEYSVSQDSNDNWHPTDNGNIGLYLPNYGTYYVRIRARTSSDVYSDIAHFRFTIEKPFWATWWFIVLMVIVALNLLWLLILLVTRRILRRRQKAYEADMKYQRMEFKALNALMNPHFIFNTLNNIQNLFKNNGNRADEYFVTFARLIRQNMQNVTKDVISLEQELNLVANYLKLEKLRFDEFVNYRMDVDPELDLDNVFIPPLLIQPLVENAIRHGLLPKQSADNYVTVHVFEKGKSLLIEIRDNGVGLSKKTDHIDPQHESLGLSNLRKRIEHMNRTRTEVFTFELIEQKDERGRISGTLARIEIASDRW